MIDLREYQHNGIGQVREKIREGRKKIPVIAPTGSGKTVIFSSILAMAAARGSRSLVLAHRRELISQTYDKVTACGVVPGVIQAGVRPAPQRPIQIASIQTLAKRTDSLGKVDIVVVDEAHHATTKNTYAQILNYFPQAIVLGFTATPWRLDGAGLADVFDSHVIIRTPRELRDEGYLVGVTGWEYSPVDTKGVKVTAGDFNGAQLEQRAMSKKLFGEIIHEWKEHSGGVRTVLFACTINHSKAMAHAFREAGVPAEHVDGTTPHDERAAILGRLKSGETRVLCNVNVATEGWDEPAIECIALCRPTLSTTLALQMIGRGLRPSPGKTILRIHDHARVLATHGHPYAVRDFSPEKSVKGERKASESASFKRDLRCQQCRAVIVSYPCDGCQYQPTPQEIAHDKQAQKSAILSSPGWEQVRARIDKQKAVAARFRLKSHEEKRQTFLRLVEKHGSRKALGVYHWMSGESEWPHSSWRLEPAVVRHHA